MNGRPVISRKEERVVARDPEGYLRGIRDGFRSAWSSVVVAVGDQRTGWRGGGRTREAVTGDKPQGA